MINFRSNYSRNIILRMIIAAIAITILLVFARGFIYEFYLRDQLTYTGIVINSGIILLFLAGMLALVMNLLRYSHEETMLTRFVRNLNEERTSLTEGVHTDSIIHQRYDSILAVSRQHTQADHGALASMLLANESTRISFPKFVNNILILTGVFGTIVALAIALVGASDLLDSTRGLGSMNLVIHGMSTALSTTITAIICYVVFGYFYLKLTDAQTHLVSAVEQVTSIYLMPQFTHQVDKIEYEVTDFMQSLNSMLKSIRETQNEYAQAGAQLRETIGGLEYILMSMHKDLDRVQKTLMQGFRLPPSGD